MCKVGEVLLVASPFSILGNIDSLDWHGVPASPNGRQNTETDSQITNQAAHLQSEMVRFKSVNHRLVTDF